MVKAMLALLPNVMILYMLLFTGHKNVPKQPSTGVRIPFNNRLSSSTPDPEKSNVLNAKYFQVITAEKESNLPPSGALPGQASGQFSLGTRPVFAGASLGVTSELVMKPHVNYNHSQLAMGALQTTGQTVTLPSATQEPGGEGRCGSVIEAFLPYVARESAGFAPPTFGNVESKATGIGSNFSAPVGLCDVKTYNNEVGDSSQLSQSTNIPSTAETSGTEYANLPSVEKKIQPVLSGTYTMENGLYQIHSTENISDRSDGTLKEPISPFRPIDGQQQAMKEVSTKYPTFEIPERDDSGKIGKQYGKSILVPDVASQKSWMHASVDVPSSMNTGMVPGNMGMVPGDTAIVSDYVTKVGTVQNLHGSHSRSLSSEESLGFIPFQTGLQTRKAPLEHEQQTQKKPVAPTNPTGPVIVQIPTMPKQQTAVPLLSPAGQVDQVLVVGSDGSQQLVPIVTQGMMGNSQYSNPGHPESDAEVRRLKHLLKELKECSKISSKLMLIVILLRHNHTVA